MRAVCALHRVRLAVRPVPDGEGEVVDEVQPCYECTRQAKEPFTSRLIVESGISVRIYARPETTIVWSDVRIGGKRVRAPLATPEVSEAEAIVREWCRKASLGCAP